MSSLCTRCRSRVGQVNRVRARGDGTQIIDEVVLLCFPCRVQAGKENATAVSRRTGKDVRP